METEFIYWRHPSVPGIKIEEICGGEDKSGKLWKDMAYQVYSENGRESYREIGHYRNGAPFLFGEEARISISHADHFLVVATLPPTPEVDLAEFSRRAALGVDAERLDREQVLAIRSRFLSPRELEKIGEDDLVANILAWTAKEACYKALMMEGVDFREDIRIEVLPELMPVVPVYDKEEFPEIRFGRALCRRGDEEVELTLYSYGSEGHAVTLAYSPQCAKFAVKRQG
ncbi:MAG: 4'-phosphopantetheinyl transferase superfamily protein [Muribaculaceae bacterium]|nr:4'-phosphopantetheinyl transferase superfamily protein [Muribaculaceae bacterium]